MTNNNEKKENLLIWNNLKQVPPECMKPIKAGRTKGMSNISPQWRLQAMTHQFGVCGIGWKYVITKKWTEECSDNQKAAFVDIDLFIKVDGEWSDAIPGHGGSMLVTKEKSGLYTSDEAFKMAITDALSVSMKAIGVASDVYIGNFDGSKYLADTSTVTNAPAESLVDLEKKLHRLMMQYNLNNNFQVDLGQYYNGVKNIKKRTSSDIEHFIDNFETVLVKYKESICDETPINCK